MKNVVLISLLAASLADAGTTWTWSASSEGATQQVVVKCQDDSVRIEMTNRVVAWDGRNGVLRIVKKRSNSDVAQTKKELEAARAKRREAHFADLARYAPKDRRAALEADWLAAERNEWKFSPLGQKRDVGPYRCEQYSGTLAGDEAMFCVVPWASVAGLACMKSFWEAMELSGPAEPEMAVLGSLRAWPGYPVRAEHKTDEGPIVLSLESVTTCK